MSPEGVSIFSYEAQSNDGQRLAGTLDAASLDAAMGRLQALQLRVVRLEPATARTTRGRALTSGDFVAFNQQLAQLTRAGLPVERGLRLIAADLKRGRLAHAVGQVADELEGGASLAEAFTHHRGQFPRLYGRLIDAGVRSGDLPSVLLGLGRHLEMLQRLRAALWRAVAYPLVVLVALALVLAFLGMAVIPRFEELFFEFRLALPWPTQALLAISGIGPIAIGVLVVLTLLTPILWAWVRFTSWGGALGEWIVLPMPLIGPVLRRSLAARWCDAAMIAISAGLDLPAAIELAGDATGSRAMQRDGAALVELLGQGVPLSLSLPRLLPASIPASIEFAAKHNDLPTVLQTLAEMYQRQAELRVDAIPAILTPLLLLFIAVSVGFVLVGLLLPLVQLISGISNWKL